MQFYMIQKDLKQAPTIVCLPCLTHFPTRIYGEELRRELVRHKEHCERCLQPVPDFYRTTNAK